VKRHKRFLYGSVVNTIISFTLVNALNIKVFAAPYAEDILSTGKQIVKEYYIEDVPTSQLDGAKDVKSLVESLKDPYSSYFTEEEFNDFNNTINNSFAGIGVQIEASNEGIKLVAVYENSPAQEAGLKLGDIITEADGHALSGMSTDEAVTFIRGVADSTVNLKVKRGSTLLSFQVKRRQIELPTVEGSLVDKHIGYIRIATFGENTASEFKNKLDELKNSAADSYIIDLRYNPGGYINTATDIAGYFIGDNVTLRSYSKSGKSQIYYAIKHQEIIDKPIVFLINEYSASASEILSAAVKDNKKAVFIGEKTYGKGVAQSMFMLPDNSYMKLTIFRFVSPLGNEINKVGVAPDIKVIDDVEHETDSLNAARLLLNSSKVSGYENISIDKLYSLVYSSIVDVKNVKTQKAINEARTAIAALRGTDASFFIGEFSKQVDLVQHPLLVKIVQAIEEAQASVKQSDINLAKAAIDPELPAQWRSSYSSAIDMIQQKLMKDALEAYDKAQETKSKADVDEAAAKFLEIEGAGDTSVSNWAKIFNSELKNIASIN
jgi:C-terminal peptidase prc